MRGEREELFFYTHTSDTNYPEIAQTPQVESSVPQDCPHFSSLELLYFWPTGSVPEVITIRLLTFSNFLECFTELRKALCLARCSPGGCKGLDTTEWAQHNSILKDIVITQKQPRGREPRQDEAWLHAF